VTRRSVSTVAIATLAALLGAARPAAAQSRSTEIPPDFWADNYVASSDAWNGLSRLVSIAKGMGLTVEATNNIDWSELTRDDILFILYPQGRLQASHVVSFVRNGGHVLVADDFGQVPGPWGWFRLLRHDAVGVGAVRFHDDLPWAPIATAWNPDHPLARDVTELATNHPAVFESEGPEIVFGFGAGEGVVAAGDLQSGRFIALSDPSVFINRMLQFDGNVQFAINALRYLSRPGDTERLVILAGDFDLYGEPTLLDDGTMHGSIANMLKDFNRWLDERNDYLLTPDGLRVLAVLGALIVVLIGLVSLPVRRRTPLEGAWTRATPTQPAIDDFEMMVHHFDTEGRRGNHLLPAAVLRDTLNTRLESLLDCPEPLYTLREAQLYDGITAQKGARAAAATRKVYRRLKSLPSRVQAASPWSVGYLSRREFERLHADVEEVFARLKDTD